MIWFTHLDGTISHVSRNHRSLLARHPIDHLRRPLAQPAFGRQRLAGIMVFELDPTWSAGSGDMVRAWVTHNIEEVGQLKNRLPPLHSSILVRA
jgi:hypothetical protein